ncbi:MAG TPA: DNA mismatch repair endonuclease MutL [bacterium]|jgi:DNA mismatch repair protein MutL|nr:DNA mismatch repair endonuclease MutL [bacterium]
MPKIALLDSTVSDQIAAGEVVERPSSVVKELVENALDAGAKQVRVEVDEAGRGLIRVADDGEGMDAEDLALSVKRHATSKIRATDDLLSLSSFGFRGEALPSIASVSRTRIVTRARGAQQAWGLEVEGGRVGALSPQGRAEGTTIEVRRLFYNTPARLKFLKSDTTENGRIASDLSQMALAHPDVAFHLVSGGRIALDLPAAAQGSERLRQLWGGSLAGAALPVDHGENGVHVRGWIAPPQLSRGQRSGQWLYVNRRVVEHRQLGFHLSQAFGSLLPHGRHAVAALFVELPSVQVDVNVHPAKREVRFRQESQVLDCIRHGVTAALRSANLYTGIDLAASASLPSGALQSLHRMPPHYGAAPSHASEAVHGFVKPLAVPLAETTADSEHPLLGSLLPRSASSAQPSHTQASPWTLPVSAPAREDWPVPLAQLHRSYLLCQDAQGLVVVDQHAAHERVLYERQLNLWAKHAVKSQRLLLPQRVQVNAAQAERLEGFIAPLAELGLELESVGGGLFFVSALPEFMKNIQAQALVQDLLEPGGEAQPASGDKAEDFRREAAAMIACKAAIKAGDPIVWESMQQLMADLAACEIPWSCPHGRPPLVRLSLVELEKYFQRR